MITQNRAQKLNATPSHRVKFGRVHLAVVATVLAGGSIGVWGWTRAHSSETHLYTPAGFGGYVGADRKPQVETPLQKATVAYSNGKFADAEQIANDVIQQANGLPNNVEIGHQGLLARRILAYSSARQKRYGEAKTRFEALRQAAYESPNHGALRVAVGEVAPTLEEEGAFQEAVCTGAQGDTKAAEHEYDDFMRRYPQSILVHAAVKRIGRFHGGDIPKASEAIWKEAMAVQKAADEDVKRSEALCGPECLSELLRRQGRKSDVGALAAEMHTTGEGTNLIALQKTAKRHGLKLEGMALSEKGLSKQKLPLVALIQPGHYVLVEKVAPAQVSVWDPDAKGIGIGGRRTFSTADWAKAWGGVALR
ncbi:MAG: apxIB [Chthonomonadales bacterium]|nr:apxIB [Chthonomonadales bacterium]